MAYGPLNRRTFLQRAFAFSAAASLTGCAAGTMSSAPVSQSAAAPTADASHILMLGDWGWGTDNNQSLVASAMQTYVAKNGLGVDALLMLGDNFYNQLPGGVDSTLWQTLFEQMYPQTVFNCPAYAVVGNHDYQNAPQSKIAAELAYAARGGTRWTLPSLYYTFTFPAKNPLITFVALDSNRPNEPTNPEPTDSSFFTPSESDVSTQMAWLSAQLQTPPSTPFLAFMAHHPVYSNGVFGDNGTLVSQLDPLLRQSNAHLYIAGHNHDLEHLEFAGHPTSFVGAGGGGAALTPPSSNLSGHGPFNQESYGFTHLEVRAQTVTLRFIDQNGNLVHAFSKTPAGAVTILA